jgi:uncharacterized protein YbaR (Trm112 family)
MVHEQSAKELGISPELLRMLVCPIDKAALEATDHALVCTTCRREYPVNDGIPNMVVD